MGFIHFLELILITAILLVVGIPLFGKLKLKAGGSGGPDQ